VPNPVVHFEIIGPDGPSLQGFYRDLFGWKVDADNEWNYGMVETGGEGGINGGVGSDPGGASRSTIYVAVDQPQKYLDKAKSLGATELMPETDLGMVTIAMFADPAGNVTGLVKNGNGAA
jgi:predicted enzyme related to lactoylglutathione lyase